MEHTWKINQYDYKITNQTEFDKLTGIKKSYSKKNSVKFIINLTRLSEMRKAMPKLLPQKAGVSNMTTAGSQMPSTNSPGTPGQPPHGNAKLQLLPSKTNPNIKRWQNPYSEEQGEERQPKADENKEGQAPQQQPERPAFKRGDRVAFQLAGGSGMVSGKVKDVSDNYVGVQSDEKNEYALPIRNVQHVGDTEPAQPKKENKRTDVQTTSRRSKEVRIKDERGQIQKGLLLENGELWQVVGIGNYIDYVKLGELHEDALIMLKRGNNLFVTTTEGKFDLVHKSLVVQVKEGTSRKAVDHYASKVEKTNEKLANHIEKLKLTNMALKEQLRDRAHKSGIPPKELEKIEKQLLIQKTEKEVLQQQLKDRELKLANIEKWRLEDRAKEAKSESERKQYVREIESLDKEIENIVNTDYTQIRFSNKKDQKSGAEFNPHSDFVEYLNFDHILDIMYKDMPSARERMGKVGGLQKYHKKEMRRLLDTNRKTEAFNRAAKYAQDKFKEDGKVEAFLKLFGPEENLFNDNIPGETLGSWYIEDETTDFDQWEEMTGMDSEDVENELVGKNNFAIEKTYQNMGVKFDDLHNYLQNPSQREDFIQKLTNNIISTGITDTDIYTSILKGDFGGDTPDADLYPEASNWFEKKQRDQELEQYQAYQEMTWAEQADFITGGGHSSFLDNSDFEKLISQQHETQVNRDKLTPEEAGMLDLIEYDDNGNPVMEELSEAERKEVNHILSAAETGGQFGVGMSVMSGKMTEAMHTAEIIADRLIKQAEIKEKESGELDKHKEKITAMEKEFLDKYLYKRPKAVGKSLVHLFGRVFRLFKTQLGLFDAKQSAFVRKVNTRPQFKMDRQGKMALLPSQKDPRKRRWQRTDKDVHEGKQTMVIDFSSPSIKPETKSHGSEAKKEPWEMTKEDFLKNRKMKSSSQNGKEMISVFPGGYETGIYPELGYQRPNGSAVAFGKKMTASEWQRKGIAETDIKKIGERIHREIIEIALNDGKPVPPEVLKDYPELQKQSDRPRGETVTEFSNLSKSNRKLHKKYEFQGLPISIENRAGSTRSGVDPDGHEWETTMKYDYGYIRLTEGVDGDHLDCYVGSNKETDTVFIVHQNNPDTGKYDEDKVFLGFDNAVQVEKVFKEHYDSDKFFGAMTQMPMEQFKKFVDDKRNRGKVAAFDPKLTKTVKIGNKKYKLTLGK